MPATHLTIRNLQRIRCGVVPNLGYPMKQSKAVICKKNGGLFLTIGYRTLVSGKIFFMYVSLGTCRVKNNLVKKPVRCILTSVHMQ